MCASSRTYVVGLVSDDDELTKSFTASLGEGTGNGITLKGLVDLCLEPVSSADLASEGTQARLRDADLCLLLVRHVDLFSVERLRSVVRQLPPPAAARLHALICREQGQTDYKISCTKCGQKLLVPDTMAMRRARCPHCREFFTVPGQVDVVRSELLLPVSRLVRVATLGDRASCAKALEILGAQVVDRAEDLKSTTMRLDVLPES